MAIGSHLYLAARGVHSDNSITNITSKVHWAVTGNIGSIDLNGNFTATAAGQGDVNITYNGFSASTSQISTVSAVAPTLVKIAAQGLSMVFPGQNTQYAALGIYDDGSARTITKVASWTAQGGIGTVTNGGLLSASQGGSGRLQVSYQGIVASTPNITVSSGKPSLAPTNLNGTLIGATQVNLKWTVSAGAETYIVLRDGERIGSTTIESYVDTGLIPSTTYTYTIEAFSSNGVSPQSAAYKATTGQPATPSLNSLPPAISYITPSSIPADANLHQLTIVGSNFATSGHLRITDPIGNLFSSLSRPGRVVSVTASRWVYNINDASAAGTWHVQVINNDGQSSNLISFAVIN